MRRYGHSKLSKMAAAAILNLFESNIAPLDPPSQKTTHYNQIWSGSDDWLQRYGHLKFFQDGGGRHLGFVRTGNCAIRSAVPENPTLEQNMKWIGRPRVCYPYYSMTQRPGPSHKPTGINWIRSMYGANDASCTSDGTTSYLTMKSCIVPACSASRTSIASEDWVSLGTSPDFDAVYQQTRSYKSVPSRGMVSGLHRSGDAPVAHRRPPGPTRSAAIWV